MRRWVVLAAGFCWLVTIGSDVALGFFVGSSLMCLASHLDDRDEWAAVNSLLTDALATAALLSHELRELREKCGKLD